MSTTNTLPMEFLTIKEQTYEIVDGYARSLLENGGGTGSGAAGNGIADWNQNDENGEGYIQNRPFYMTREPSETTETVEVLPESTYALQDSMGMYEAENVDGITLEVGAAYIITIDGVEYENMVCVDFNGVKKIGTENMQFTDYPFMFVVNEEMFGFAYPEKTGTNCTVSIRQEKTTVDIGEMNVESKYISHFQSDWNCENENSIGFIKNKPFGEKNEFIEIIKTAELEFAENNGMYGAGVLVTRLLEANQEYKVIWDDVEYNLVPYEQDYFGLVIGAKILDMNAPTFDFSEYPFLIMVQENDGQLAGMIISETDGRHTVGLSANINVVTKINEKFIPSQDWEAVPGQDGYIKNRPFYTDYENFGDEIVLYERDIASGNFSVYDEYSCITIYTEKELSSKSRFGVMLTGEQYYPLKASYDSNEGVYCLGDDFNTFSSGSSTYPFYIEFREGSSSVWLAITPEALSDSVAFAFVEFPPLVVPIDEKYIPDTIMRTGVIDEQYIPDSIMRTTDTLPKWNGKSMEIVTELPASPDENTFYIILES